jgi:hypothetical protein
MDNVKAVRVYAGWVRATSLAGDRSARTLRNPDPSCIRQTTEETLAVTLAEALEQVANRLHRHASNCCVRSLAAPPRHREQKPLKVYTESMRGEVS